MHAPLGKNCDHQEHLERIGPLNEPFPLACEHHFAPITKNRVGACKCVRCGLVSHDVLPSQQPLGG